MAKCRHNRTWVTGGGTHEWCYECGALRQMRHVGANGVTPYSYWVRPVGEGGENPYEKNEAVAPLG